jgi:hypothetical protein
VWPEPITESEPTAKAGPSPANILPSPAPERLGPPAPQASAAKYLTQAIHSLRIEREPGAALRLLDGHGRELARGGFGHEALILRVEALLALGRRAEVLRLLDDTSLTDVAASRALLVTRGELRAAASRCADGVVDFDLVLARAPETDRRALVGRALCRKQLGDAVGMRADIERLHKEFPYQSLPRDLER